jgi:GNAT superfamily N-acetyltransferase
MRLAIQHFSAEHLDGAARLLAARHRADREREPRLPAAFERVESVRPVVEATAGFPGTNGAVALRGGRVVGFLLGSVFLPQPAHRGSLFLHPRSAFVSYGGHAAEPGDVEAVYRALYAAVSPAWVEGGYFAHYVAVPASDPTACDAWFSLGFGRDATTALRETEPPPSGGAEVEIRRGGLDDLDGVVRMALGLYHHHAGPPMYLPYLAEIEPDERAYQERLLADPGCAHWLASRDGRVIGMQSFESPPTFVSPLLRPEGCIYLLHGFTDPGARGGGVGRALLRRSLAWAREAGYPHCLLHFLASNLAAARFWLASGFRPVEVRLSRHVDERIAWARPR